MSFCHWSIGRIKRQEAATVPDNAARFADARV
jgi:hypothetical protein